MNIEQLKQKWGGSLPQVGDWGQSMNHPHKFEDHNSLPSSYESFSPIPLTREVLEKIGEISFQNILDVEHICLQISELDTFHLDTYSDGGVDMGLGTIHPIVFKYLHQLQQLYRLFTSGEELTYTP